MDYKIIISDRSFNVIDEVQNIASNISWDYNRIGGCGAFSFDVPTRFCTETSFGMNFNVKIQRRIPSTSLYENWYQGRIENKIASVDGVKEMITVQGFGYQSQLKDIYIDSDYSADEASVIITDFLDNHIVPNTDITYDAGDIDVTTFTFDTLEVNKDALDAIKTVSDTVGTREWGVNKDRKLFFVERNSTVGFRYYIGSPELLKYSTDISSKDLVNRVIVFGGDVADVPFTRVVNNTKSQLKWKRRDKVINNSSIVTNSVADQFADSIFEEFKNPITRSRLDLLLEQLIEATIPIPLIQVVAEPLDTYGTKEYGDGLYNSIQSFQVSRIQYKIDRDSNLVISMQLGQPRPNLAESLSQLEYKIDQISQQGV